MMTLPNFDQLEYGYRSGAKKSGIFQLYLQDFLLNGEPITLQYTLQLVGNHLKEAFIKRAKDLMVEKFSTASHPEMVEALPNRVFRIEIYVENRFAASAAVDYTPPFQ